MRIARLTTDIGPSYATWTDDGWALIEEWTGGPPEPTGDVIFLASPASDFVNGQILYVDGGMTAVV